MICNISAGGTNPPSLSPRKPQRRDTRAFDDPLSCEGITKGSELECVHTGGATPAQNSIGDHEYGIDDRKHIHYLHTTLEPRVGWAIAHLPPITTTELFEDPAVRSSPGAF